MTIYSIKRMIFFCFALAILFFFFLRAQLIDGEVFDAHCELQDILRDVRHASETVSSSGLSFNVYFKMVGGIRGKK